MIDWHCLACRVGRHEQCDRLRGCECIGYVLDRQLIPCAALLPEEGA